MKGNFFNISAFGMLTPQYRISTATTMVQFSQG